MAAPTGTSGGAAPAAPGAGGWETQLVALVMGAAILVFGIVPQPLDETVHDLADRKMVAAAIAALQLPGSSAVAFAGDTDWYDWEAALLQTGLTLEPIIETWSRAKYAEKALRQAKKHHQPKHARQTQHQKTPQGLKS